HFAEQTYKGKVVFITGGSAGIGLEIATFYARAGAAVVVTARRQQVLDDACAAILKAAPGADVLTISLDVVQTEQVEAAVKETLDRFGKIDICIANAAMVDRWDRPFLKEDPNKWWQAVEVNVRGNFNAAYYTLAHLAKTKGYFITITSEAAQLRMPIGSSYLVSKHALGRFVELAALENPEVKVMAVHPGGIKTDGAMTNPEFEPFLTDSLQLPAATLLYLTSGKADWLNGRFVSSNWDLEEVERVWKDKIVEEQALVSRLHVPSS
ncbi:NAD-P-binding protein, partial [Dentipellis sp. KUC8613]